MHLLLSETIFSPLPLRTAEISSVGGVWVFSGMTHYGQMFVDMQVYPLSYMYYPCPFQYW